MGKILLIILGLIFIACSVELVYDARELTCKWFGFGDKNEGAMGLKFLGYLLLLVGLIILYFV